jgi:hypothetical protein
MDNSSSQESKADLIGVATALVDLASTSAAQTDDVMCVLNVKLERLSLAHGLAAPTAVVVANPTVTARKQNQARHQPANSGPTTKATTIMAKQKNKQKKQQQQAAKQASIG